MAWREFDDRNPLPPDHSVTALGLEPAILGVQVPLAMPLRPLFFYVRMHGDALLELKKRTSEARTTILGERT